MFLQHFWNIPTRCSSTCKPIVVLKHRSHLMLTRRWLLADNPKVVHAVLFQEKIHTQAHSKGTKTLKSVWTWRLPRISWQGQQLRIQEPADVHDVLSVNRKAALLMHLLREIICNQILCCSASNTGPSLEAGVQSYSPQSCVARAA